MNETSVPDYPEKDSEPIPDVSAFGSLILAWHQHSMRTLDMLANIPAGQELTVALQQDGPEETFVMEGDKLLGFQIAMVVAMDIFGRLPFETKEADHDPAASSK